MFKALMPVPSPNGTNHENLYMTVPRGLAYDALPSGMRRDERRRLGRDDEPLNAETAMSQIEQLFEELPETERLDLVDALRKRLSGGGDDRRPHAMDSRGLPTWEQIWGVG
jgi:hypothetical protein